MASFGVHDVARFPDRVVVIGRCYTRVVRIGCVFRMVYDQTAGGTQSIPTPVELTVTRIVAYKREIDELDEGLTGELTLRGRGGENVMRQHVLSTGAEI